MDRPQLKGWPRSETSRFLRVRPHDWHLQDSGTGPALLLLHGTGASTHSWRDLIPHFVQNHRVLAVDLPGHGFTRLGTRLRSGLGPVAEDLHRLLTETGADPVAIIGHSAGAAIGLRLAQRLDNKPAVIGINPALQPFQDIAGVMFPMTARMMAITPGLSRMLARSLSETRRVLPLLRSTGSDLSVSGLNLYARLFRDADHVDGTLLMMSQWKLDGLLSDLPSLTSRCLFLTGSQDRMVPPVSAVQAAERMPDAQVQSLDGYGHLVHEEAPSLVADVIASWLADTPKRPA